MSSLYDHSANLIRRIYDSRLSDPPVFDTAERFPAVQRFVDAWPSLRDEALQLAENIGQVPVFMSCRLRRLTSRLTTSGIGVCSY